MDCTPTRLDYRQTGFFSKMITDYLDCADTLKDFIGPCPDLPGVRSAILSRKQFPTNRVLLVEELRKQYAGIDTNASVLRNIEQLGKPDCFTVTTAHQPALFTGPLYFLYKILHAIKLADYLKDSLPEFQFVPVFCMGSEDADLEELNKIYLDHREIVWDTRQTGAVGRMKTEGLDKLIENISGEFAVQPFGKELIGLLQRTYLESENIQTACFRLVDALFSEYGLVVVIPDNLNFKRKMQSLFADDLFDQVPFQSLARPLEKLSGLYKIQAHPREINLFYLRDDLRGRIERTGDHFIVHESNLRFTESELKKELADHPDRFSPNVILRGIYQETILPNIIFLGGGGELAYWMELKSMFEHFGVPFPVLVLRNSFLVLEKRWKEKMDRTGVTVPDLFRPEEELVNELVRKESGNQLDLEKEIVEANRFYERLKAISSGIDPTLSQHVESLQSKAVKPIMELEKKLLKAEKRKFEEQQKLIGQVKAALFPANELQERVENFIPYYASRGRRFLRMIYDHSLALEQKFTVLEELE